MGKQLSRKQKRWLTLFPLIYSQLLHKDVGAIPYYLTYYDWRSSIVYLSDPRFKLVPYNQDFTQHVELVSLGFRSNRVTNALRIIKYLILNGKEYDVVNLYHDSFAHLIYAFAYKAIGNRSGKVFIKPEISNYELNDIVNCKKNIIKSIIRRIKYQLSRFAVDYYSVETTDCYKLLVDEYYYKGRLYYVQNGINCPETIDINYVISSKENIILTVGNLGSAQKYNELLIDAIALLDPSLIQNWRVYLVGPLVNSDFCEIGYKNEGGLADYVADVVARQPHLKNTFVFTGTICDRDMLFDLYRKAKIFCLTSRYESFGFVIPESMFFGDYVIASDLPSIRDLTDNGRLGALFQVGDVNALCMRLSEAMLINEDISSLGKAAHEFAKSNANWQAIVKKIDEIVSC